jgi:subtilisin family serine protease
MRPKNLRSRHAMQPMPSTLAPSQKPWRSLATSLASGLVLASCVADDEDLGIDTLESTAFIESGESGAVRDSDDEDSGDDPAIDDDPLPLSADRAALPPFVPFEAIVKFRPAAPATFRANLATAARIEELAADTNLVRFDVDQSAGLAARDPIAATWAQIDELRASGDVEYAHPNWLLTPSLTPNDKYYSHQWHYPKVNLPAAWDLTTGSPTVRLAILDTGRTPHGDLTGKWVPGVEYDAYSEDGDVTSTTTWNHGVAVASIAGGSSNNSKHSTGACWNCQLLNVDVEVGQSISMGAVIRGTYWAIENGARVINMSFETALPCSAPAQPDWDIPALRAAMEFAASKNVTIVAAAGNAGLDAKNTSPASCPGVIAVAATDKNNGLASYSNYGSVLLAAPGGAASLVGGKIGADAYGMGLECDPDVYSNFTNGNQGVVANWTTSTGDNCDRYLSGTSLAAPHVTGVVGLMLSRNPSLTPPQIRQILQSTAQPACNGKCGAGLLNAFAAVAQAAPLPVNDAKPSADFSVQCAGLQCTFNASNSKDDKSIVAYEWILPGEQFRMGSTFSAFMPGYGFQSARLRVTDTHGQSTLIKRNFTISQPIVTPVFGQYHNPQRPDNRLDVYETHDAALVVAWYTFDSAGLPVWYTSGAGHRLGARWTQPLYKSSWKNGVSTATPVGTVSLDFSSSSVAWFSWVLDGVPGGERFTYLFGGKGRSGAWYVPTQPGWGIHVQESGQALEAAVGFYHAKKVGNVVVQHPAWMRSKKVLPGSNLAIPLTYYTGKGLCPSCGGKTPATAVNSWSLSSMKLQIANDASTNGFAATDIMNLYTSVWKRPLQAISILTKP